MNFEEKIADDYQNDYPEIEIIEFKEITIDEITDGVADFIVMEDLLGNERYELRELINHMDYGNEVPALVVQKSEDGYFLLDGYHRFYAANYLQLETILVAIIKPLQEVLNYTKTQQINYVKTHQKTKKDNEEISKTNT